MGVTCNFRTHERTCEIIIMGSIKHKIRSIAFKAIIMIKERKFKELKYLLFYNKSKYLLVVFSAFPGMGKRPSYNYLNTFSGLKASRLYILDNVRNIGGGSYYLGENGDFYMPQQVCDLILSIKRKTKSDYLIFAGTSKGATSAIYYSLLLNADYCVIGAPQYYIGNYLNTADHIRILEELCGDNPEFNINYLNGLVSNLIKNKPVKKTKIFLQYSHLEETYPGQIKQLIYDCELNDVNIVLNDINYIKHNDVAMYYPEYANRIIENIMAGLYT